MTSHKGLGQGEIAGLGTYSIRREQLDALGISDEELLDACQKRLDEDAKKATVAPMGAMLGALTGRDPEDFASPVGMVVF